MELISDSSWLSLAVKVFYIDLLLGIDNALLIALVCRSLPPRERRDAIVVGTIGAVLLRTLLSGAVGLLLNIPYLRLVGGLILFGVALTISEAGQPVALSDGPRPPDGSEPAPAGRKPSFGSAVALIILADAVMSFDNVVAIGGVAEGRTAIVFIGLALSVPLVMFGGWIMSQLIERLAAVVILGSLVVAWIGGEIAVSDPALATFVRTQAPALFIVVPALAALFVLLDRRPPRASQDGKQPSAIDPRPSSAIVEP